MSWAEVKLLMNSHDGILEKMVTGVNVNGRVPISMGYVSKSIDGTVTNLTVCDLTGKGKVTLFIHAVIDIVVDGATLVSNYTTATTDPVIDIEFEKSFSIVAVKRPASTTGYIRLVWQLF